MGGIGPYINKESCYEDPSTIPKVHSKKLSKKRKKQQQEHLPACRI